MVGSISGSSYQSSMLSQLTQKLFSMMDEDGSGSSSQTETSGVSGQESSLIDALFSKADSDGSDAITQQEFASMLSQLFQEMKGGSSEGMSNAGAPPPPPDSSEMISSLDTDGDGSLSVDEMTAGGIRDAEKLFSDIDTDGDGLASEDELDAFGEKMKADGPQSASTDSESNSTISLQTEFLDKLIEMISQYKGYTDSTADSTSIFA